MLAVAQTQAAATMRASDPSSPAKRGWPAMQHDAQEGDGDAEDAPPMQRLLEDDGGEEGGEGDLDLHGDGGGRGIDLLHAGRRSCRNAARPE